VRKVIQVQENKPERLITYNKSLQRAKENNDENKTFASSFSGYE